MDKKTANDTYERIKEMRAIVELLVEESDDPCRRNQHNPGAVYISVVLELRARKAVK